MTCLLGTVIVRRTGEVARDTTVIGCFNDERIGLFQSIDCDIEVCRYYKVPSNIYEEKKDIILMPLNIYNKCVDAPVYEHTHDLNIYEHDYRYFEYFRRYYMASTRKVVSFHNIRRKRA